jgi:serine/threonine protein phosphatase PrpC
MHPVMTLRAVDTVARTDTGRQRRDNEDSMLARAPVFVIADGMGGAQAGEVASRIAIETFEQGLPDTGSPEERLSLRVQEANQRIHELSVTEDGAAGMGTTLTAAYLDDTHLSVAHVGDSRAYLFRDGKLERLTQDHSLVEELVRRGKLTAEQAAEHPQRSIITRALGPEATVEVDTWTYPVRAGDVLLLCSDGLTSMISEERVAEILGSTDDLGIAADDLIDDANEAGGRDNITVVLFRLEAVGSDGTGTDQPTLAGVKAPPAPSEPREPKAPRRRGASRRVPLARSSRARRESEQGVRPRRDRRYIKPVAALLATLIVLFLVGGGGYLATRQLYFIGTNSQGVVTIFRGLPYSLPFGIRLYETFYVSGVPASVVPSDRRSAFLNNDLRSETSAQALVHDLELGKISS